MVLWAVITTFFYGTFLGWLVHWGIHQRWSGFAHRSHMTHHLKLYPPSNLLSETYRDAGKDNTTYIFTPIIAVGFLAYEAILYHWGASFWLLAGLTVEGLLIGLLHDWMHTWFHLSGTRLLKYQWFRDLRELHFYHHRRMNRNFGIYFFGWDRVFRTFRRQPLSSESR